MILLEWISEEILRFATRNVDFFKDDSDKNDATEDAGKYAAEKLGWNRQGNWTNATTMTTETTVGAVSVDR
jgi:hypothetical protein